MCQIGDTGQNSQRDGKITIDAKMQFTVYTQLLFHSQPHFLYPTPLKSIINPVRITVHRVHYMIQLVHLYTPP